MARGPRPPQDDLSRVMSGWAGSDAEKRDEGLGVGKEGVGS